MGNRKVFLKLGKRLNNVVRIFAVILITLALGCTNKSQHAGAETASISSSIDSASVERFITEAELNHDTTIIYKRYSDYGLVEDFNGDGYPESVSLVANSKTNEIGVRILDGANPKLVNIYGAGNQFEGGKNLRWIKSLETVPSGFYVAPTLFDSNSGDILGLDSAKGFILKSPAFQLSPAEFHGSKIVYWNGSSYSWIHQE